MGSGGRIESRKKQTLYIEQRVGYCLEVAMQETTENSRARYWQRFVSTGKVEDYLQYSCHAALRENGGRQSGADPDAGFYNSDGNDIETDAYR